VRHHLWRYNINGPSNDAKMKDPQQMQKVFIIILELFRFQFVLKLSHLGALKALLSLAVNDNYEILRLAQRFHRSILVFRFYDAKKMHKLTKKQPLII
jgi:hypothetical protein